MFYLKLQFVNYKTGRELSRHASALRRYCRFFDLKPEMSPKFEDTYYVYLPDDRHLACEVINAFDAYCYYHKIASRIDSTDSFDEFIKLINEKIVQED